MGQKEAFWTGIIAIGDTSFGDSGKGKITDIAAESAHLTVRVNGGANAGHTVFNKFGEFKFHLIPSGIFNPRNVNYLSNGVLIDPVRLKDEVIELRERGVEVNMLNLRVSEAAHGVFTWHKVKDRLQEERRGKDRIGTTHQGVGPAAAQRTERSGLRMKDLILPEKKLKKKFDEEIASQEQFLQLLSRDNKKGQKKKQKSELLDRDTIWKELREASDVIGPMIGKINQDIWEAQDRGENIVLELAQGALLDPFYGEYPYVTTTHPGIGGVTVYTGINSRDIHRAIGVTKSYLTRVGEGTMPTELTDGVGDAIRNRGKEFGTTTGRPRRIGWFDVPLVRYGIRVGGFDTIALTKTDVLDELDVINVCTGYLIDGEEVTDIDTIDTDFLKKAEPIYTPKKGWQKETTGARSFEELPKENQEYILFLQDELGVPLQLVSVGPDREQTIYRAS